MITYIHDSIPHHASSLEELINNLFHSTPGFTSDEQFTAGVTLEDGTEITLAFAKQKKLEYALQKFMNETAKAHIYENIENACSYTALANPFQTESIAFFNWRSACWVALIAIIDASKVSGNFPTVSEMIAQLPTLVV